MKKTAYNYILMTLLVLLSIYSFSSCGSSGGGNGNDNVTISIEPASAIVAPGQAEEFIATIAGSSNQAVTWSASAGEIIEKDEFTAYIAPDSVGEYTLTVTSVANASKSAMASITVKDIGVLLTGEPDALTKDAVTDLNIKLESDEDDISIDDTLPYGGKVLRTDIFIEFSDTATVGEVNTLLGEINGAIIHMIEVLPTMIIRIPDPVTIDALNQIIADVEAKPFVKSAIKSVIAEADDMPGAFSTIYHIDHNVAVRAFAAWNIKSTIPDIKDRPWLLIHDSFGNGEPNNDFNTETVDYDYTLGKPRDHGYHVLGIIAGSYGMNGADVARGEVTGIFPERLKVRAEDAQYVHNRPWTHMMMNFYDRIRTIKDIKRDAHIVINASWGGRGQHNKLAVYWTKLIRKLGVENQVIYVTSAGNTREKDTDGQWVSWQASDNCPFAYAALGTMTDDDGTVIPNLTNTLVVENRINTLRTSTSRPKPGCVSDRSIMGGNLSAIGTNVWSFTSTGADYMSGTSMASPQAAGLAAYVWSLNPELNAFEVVQLLQSTARSVESTTENLPSGVTCNPAATHQDVIDAYDAVLAAGGEKARLKLLDYSGINTSEPDGVFDEHDLERFLTTYAAFDPTREYYYFAGDLNGNGFRGDDSRDRFDLDDIEFPRFRNVTQNIEGTIVTYDETALTDLDILCYYAYSPLYIGDTEKRTELLGDECNVKLDFPVTYTGPGSYQSSASFDFGDKESRTCGADSEWTVTLNADGTLYGHYVITETQQWGGGAIECIVRDEPLNKPFSGTHADGDFRWRASIYGPNQYLEGTYDSNTLKADWSNSYELTHVTGKYVGGIESWTVSKSFNLIRQ